MTTDKITVNSNGTSNVQVPPVQYGWKCPSCGAVMAPWQNTCVNCHGGSGIQYPNFPQVTYENAPWWMNPAYKWEITCGTKQDGNFANTVTTAKDTKYNTTTWNKDTPCTFTGTAQNDLRASLKSAGINI